MTLVESLRIPVRVVGQRWVSHFYQWRLRSGRTKTKRGNKKSKTTEAGDDRPGIERWVSLTPQTALEGDWGNQRLGAGHLPQSLMCRFILWLKKSLEIVR